MLRTAKKQSEVSIVKIMYKHQKKKQQKNNNGGSYLAWGMNIITAQKYLHCCMVFL